MKSRLVASLFVGLLLQALPAMAGPFAGKFSDSKLTAQWSDSAAGYTGTISLGSQSFPASGTTNGQTLTGSFTAGSHSFPFTATLNGDTLRFVTGSTTFALARRTPSQPAAGNPLDGATPASAGVAPADYTVVSNTDAGRIMVASKPSFANLTAALQATMPELAQYFGGRPKIIREYQDTRDAGHGGVSFTATFNDQPVNGLVVVRITAQASAINVIYCKAGATAADWAALKGSQPRGEAAAAPAAAAPVALHPYQFPDGTGVIGLADGWTTNARTCNGKVVITGPADQVITMGFVMNVVAPGSPTILRNQQYNAYEQRVGGRPRPLGALIAPLGDPVEMWNAIAPQLSQLNQSSGAPTFTLDHLQEAGPAKALSPRAHSVFAHYGITLSANGQQIHRLVLAQLTVNPITNDTFKFGVLSVAAPDATYKQDLPTMLAITNSLNENAAEFAHQTRQTIDTMNQHFAAQQAAQNKVEAANDEHNRDVEQNQLITERSNANEDEIIRGDRTVVDTTTGEKTSVDLGNVDQVVDNLNATDPGRYKEIPLRDELYPLPGQ